MAQTGKTSSKRNAQSAVEPHEAATFLQPLSRLALHPRWDQQLFSRGQAWISVRSEGSTIIGDCFDCKVIPPSDTAAPPCTAEVAGKTFSLASRSGFRVISVTGKTVEVAYDQIPSMVTRATFHAADRVYEEIFKRNVVCVDIQGEGNYGAAVSADKVLKVWRMDNEEVRCLLKDQGDINVVKWVPSSVVIAYSSEGCNIRLHNIEKNKHLRTLRGHSAAIQELTFSDRGKNLFSASQDGTVCLWDITRTEPVEIVAVHIAEIINCISVQTAHRSITGAYQTDGSDNSTGDGRVVLYGTQDSPCLRIASVRASPGAGLLFEHPIDSPVVCCAFLEHPYFACGTDNGQLYYFDWRKPDKPLFHWREIRGGILSMTGWKDGVICGTADGSCFSRDPVTHTDNRVTVEFSGAEEPVMKICQYPGHLVTSSRDGKIRQYSLP